jgi:hypothetical protein
MLNIIFNANPFKSFFKKREILQKFRELGAFNIDLSITLDLFDKEDFKTINSLRRKNIIAKSGFEDRFFLDEKKLLEDKLNKTKWAMIFLLGIIALLFKTKL